MLPKHIGPLLVAPVDEGEELIVIIAVADVQLIIYVITAVPPETPVTTPVVPFIVATEVLPLVHVPPATVQFKVVVIDEHKVPAPVITGAVFLTPLSMPHALLNPVIKLVKTPVPSRLAVPILPLAVQNNLL